MLVRLTRMLDPAEVSDIRWGGERRAISAISTPFQLAAEQPATKASATNVHKGQWGLLSPKSAVVVAATIAATDRDRNSVGTGKSVSDSVDFGGGRMIKKKKKK